MEKTETEKTEEKGSEIRG